MVTPKSSASRGLRFNFASGIALMVAALTLGLGIWQWNRGLEKQAVLAAVKRQNAESQSASQSPVLGQSLKWVLGRPPQDLDRSTVQIRGQWLPESTFYLDNRSLNGRPGVHVLTAAVLSDKSLVWINRGWAPKPPGLDNQRATDLMAGGVHLPQDATVHIQAVGLASLMQRLELSDNPERLRQGALWQNIDWQAAQARLAKSLKPKTMQSDQVWPVIFWQTSDTGDGLQRQVPAPPQDAVDKHRGYALQWVLMSLAALVFAWRLSREKRPADRPS